MDHGVLFNTFIFLVAACLVVPLASKFKLGSVLGYLVAGVLIGPFGLSFITNPEQIMHLAEFGVVMMLFVIGLELEPETLWKMRKAIVGLGGLQVTLTSAAFTGIGIVMGYDWRVSLAVGMALALSSTALVLQILQEKTLLQTPVGETSFAVLLFQDIAVIPILIIIPLLSLNGAPVEAEHATLLSGLPGWQRALAVTGVIGGVIMAGLYLSHHMFYIIAKTGLREVFTATSLMLIVGITLLMQTVGVSPALGAFIAGVVLANSQYKHTLETDIEPFKSLLLGLFFISVGMGMDFALFAERPVSLLGTVACLMLVKAAILFGLGRVFGLSRVHNSGFAYVMCQGGEFAFVLLFARDAHVLTPEQAAFLTLVVAISIGLTPILMLYYSKVVMPCFMSILPERNYDSVDTNNEVILAGYGRFGQIIGRFLMAQGVKVTILEKDPEQVELLRKFGFKGYFGDASRLDLLTSAHADKAKMLIIAVDDADNALEIAKIAKAEFPNLKIFARARNRRHAYDLHKAGVDYFKRETFDSSLSMAQKIMVSLGYDKTEIRHRATLFRRHDEASLKQSFEFFENEPELVNFARFRAEELDRILQSDVTEKKALKNKSV